MKIPFDEKWPFSLWYFVNQNLLNPFFFSGLIEEEEDDDITGEIPIIAFPSSSTSIGSINHFPDDKRWELNYQEAAIYLQEGENNNRFDTHPSNQSALPAYLIVHNTYFFLIDLAASILLMSLALIESPAVPVIEVDEFVSQYFIYIFYTHLSNNYSFNHVCFEFGTLDITYLVSEQPKMVAVNKFDWRMKKSRTICEFLVANTTYMWQIPMSGKSVKVFGCNR